MTLKQATALLRDVEDCIESGFYRATRFKSESEGSYFNILAIETPFGANRKNWKVLLCKQEGHWEDYPNIFEISRSGSLRVVVVVDSATLGMKARIEKWGHWDSHGGWGEVEPEPEE